MIPSCTCRERPLVVSISGASSYGNDVFKQQQQHLLLEANLRRFGWSPMVVSEAPSRAPSHDQIRTCFVEDSCSDDNGGGSDLTYITAESGASHVVVAAAADGGGDDFGVEPKESYEVRLAECISPKKNDGDNDGVKNDKEERIKEWCRTMSWIAQQVFHVLDIPANTLQSESSSSSLDLLRVFHYFAIDSTAKMAPTTESITESSHNPILGSSPHTDWGSLTIVWQDGVGGLQTYCRACEKWADVPPLSTSSMSTESSSQPPNRWDCIVHVGDMASLVLDDVNESLHPEQTPQQQQRRRRIEWPSPKHRVVSSSRERTSLVYFGYPPAHLSLMEIKATLAEWKRQRHKDDYNGDAIGCCLPLEEYYLLHDQSANAGSLDSVSATKAYVSIQNLPIQEVVQTKWEQVQR